MLNAKNISEKVSDIYNRGLCCSEAIVYVFAEEAGKNAAEYMKMASGLCGGMGIGDICGAVTGGVCAIGIYLGRDSVSTAPQKKCSALSKEFISIFRKELQNIKCHELLGGLKFGIPEQRLKCSGIVLAATNFAVELINKNL